MAEQPPPSPSELLRMVTELRQVVAEENQRMANQIANLNNARTENNDRQERTEEAEQQSGPTHVSDTARNEGEQPEHNEDTQKNIGDDDQETSPGPFTAEVMNFVLPRRFTLPTTLTPYDGLGDPKKYIKKFTSIMIVNGASDKVLCRCFPSYLDGPALDWFCSLPAGSISRFRDISKPFEEHFAGSAIYLHDSDYLNTIKQGQHESLKDYITRFTKIAISILDLHPEVELHAIKSGLRPGKFQETIAVAKPKTMAEFREKARGQIDIEELRQARKTERPHHKDDDKPRDSKKNFKPIPRYETYTKFNTKRDDIIKEILNSKLIKPPRKAGNYPDSKGTDRSKYCSFHQKHGHNTDDCIIAKDLLERLARQGHLDKFIGGHMQRRLSAPGDQGSAAQHNRDRDRPNHNHPELPSRTINCISGGFAGGGATSSARKRSYRAILSINTDQSPPTSPQITFQAGDHDYSITNLDDPVVISLQLGDLLIKKVLLDPGSSADVLFYSTFQKMKLSDNIIRPSTGDLVGFSGERVPVMGSVWLQTTLGKFPSSKTSDIQYLVVDCFSTYNIILGRPFLNKFGAIVSTIHLCVKFPLQDNTIATIHSDAREARECYNNSLKKPHHNTKAQIHNIGNINNQHMLADLDPRAGTLERPTPTEDLDKIYFTENTDKFTYVGSTLSSEEKSSFQAFLQQNADLFAWTPADMPGIDPSIISHKLALDPSIRPVAQKRRNLGHDRKQASLEETKKLISAGFIREIRFTTWLANVVMVKKHNGKWRMCVDFTDLNKACPKDSYPLPSIDCLVDNASGFEKLSFMDAYSGATYQRLMDKVFAKQIGKNVEVYVDDMVAKTKIGNNHLDDLTEIFGQLRQYNMRLNPEKCAFGVQSGKFLGFMLTSQGIEANPEKCRAILDMTSPQTIKEVQRLTGRLAALSRFLPCLASKSSCFFQTLKTKRAFQWTDECEQAFTTLKETLSKPPILHTPLQGEPLLLYLSVTNWAISSALVAEREQKQLPIYFTSKTLQNAELRYPTIEKLALALVFSARRLRPYFQSHKIHVRTDQPLRQVLQKPELAGRLVKWSVELSEFDIKYESRASIKSQFLADFIAEFSVPKITEDYIEWSLYVDGSSNPHGCGAGIILDDDHGNVIEHSLHFSFKASNNQSEYEALIAGLTLAADLNITEIKVYCDSLLVVQQHIPRESNGRADILSKLASTQPDRKQTGDLHTYNISKQGSCQATSDTLDSFDDKLPFLQFIITAYINEDSLVHYLDVFADQKQSLRLRRHMKGSVEHTSEPEVYIQKSSELDCTGRLSGKIVTQKSKIVSIAKNTAR
ncbi:uncharacterized protein [Arachis hypogaea]|uniref:uncharacterized protein n=1 Tax=Arachis hypogaea TaxID=3818 RepID=UPI003B216300